MLMLYRDFHVKPHRRPGYRYSLFLCDYGFAYNLQWTYPCNKLWSCLIQVLDFTRTGWPSYVGNSKLKPYFLRSTELSVEQNCLLWGRRVIVRNPIGRKSWSFSTGTIQGSVVWKIWHKVMCGGLASMVIWKTSLKTASFANRLVLLHSWPHCNSGLGQNIAGKESIQILPCLMVKI